MSTKSSYHLPILLVLHLVFYGLLSFVYLSFVDFPVNEVAALKVVVLLLTHSALIAFYLPFGAVLSFLISFALRDSASDWSIGWRRVSILLAVLSIFVWIALLILKLAV